MNRQVSALFFVAIVSTTVHGVSEARAETFGLADGLQIEGKIVEVSGNTLIIQRENGGMLPLTRGDISWVRIRLPDLQIVEGQFDGWEDGVYILRQDQHLIAVHDGGVVSATKITEPQIGKSTKSDADAEGPRDQTLPSRLLRAPM